MQPADDTTQRLAETLQQARNHGTQGANVIAMHIDDADALADLGRRMGRAIRERDLARAALARIIEMNRDYARDRHGDPDRAETMACVIVAREGLGGEHE